MTTPRQPRTLTEAQLRQRREASAAAAAARQRRGLTPAEIEQRRQASARAQQLRQLTPEARQMVRDLEAEEAAQIARSTQARRAAWQRHEASRRQTAAIARRESERYRAAFQGGEDVEALGIDRDRERAVRRALESRGVPWEVIRNSNLDQVGWQNPALISFVRKWDNLRRRGMSAQEAVNNLFRRLERVKRRDRIAPWRGLLDLIREFYSADKLQTRRQRQRRGRRAA